MKKMNKKIKIFLIALLVINISGFGAYQIYKHNKGDGDVVYISIHQGDSVDNVINNIIKQGVNVSYKSLYNEFVSQDAKIYANEYELTTNMSAKEIVQILNNPQSNITGDKLVIIEGDNIKNIASNIAKISNGKYTQEQIINYWQDQSVLNELISQYWFLDDSILNPEILYPLEGFFAPATYPIVPDFEISDLTKKFLDSMGQNLAPYKEASARHDLSIMEFVTLASIVERETIHLEDQPKVAGVFFNRLNQNMPLQSDITVNYARQEHKEVLTYDDLSYESAYNTYLHSGLPIGPIAMVSTNCLNAVANAEDNDYLYFFALQESGEIIYSKTLEEHEKVSQEHAWQ